MYIFGGNICAAFRIIIIVIDANARKGQRGIFSSEKYSMFDQSISERRQNPHEIFCRLYKS